MRGLSSATFRLAEWNIWWSVKLSATARKIRFELVCRKRLQLGHLFSHVFAGRVRFRWPFLYPGPRGRRATSRWRECAPPSSRDILTPYSKGQVQSCPTRFWWGRRWNELRRRWTSTLAAYSKASWKTCSIDLLRKWAVRPPIFSPVRFHTHSGWTWFSSSKFA